jgi:hypothetical protein
MSPFETIRPSDHAYFDSASFCSSSSYRPLSRSRARGGPQAVERLLALRATSVTCSARTSEPAPCGRRRSSRPDRAVAPGERNGIDGWSGRAKKSRVDTSAITGETVPWRHGPCPGLRRRSPQAPLRGHGQGPWARGPARRDRKLMSWRSRNRLFTALADRNARSYAPLDQHSRPAPSSAVAPQGCRLETALLYSWPSSSSPALRPRPRRPASR